ncbi:MAG TPA: adenylate/guanylate cyclase domain-containing protein [Methylomirabilota bacterium]|nr:adenylate/guanylate cyclase domain-containing protein [Methylomirabilota bacterium]
MAADPRDPSGLREQIVENQQTIDRLNRDLARKSNEVRVIQQISSEITSTLDLDEVLEIVLRALDGILGFAHSMILLKDLADDVLRVAATRGYAEPGAGARVRMGEGVIGVVGERRRMMRIGNIGASVRYLRSVRARMEAAGEVGPGEASASLPGLPDAQSQLALPLTVKDRLVGVLAVESRTPNAFDELDEVLLRIVGNQAATAIDNARTYQMVERLGRLKRFFSPQLAELIIRGGADDPLKTHRREVAVVFLDLRGFTAFAETSEPEELMGVLREYHAEMGKLILAHEGTLERFTGDGMMIFFNDPLPVPDAAERAVRMAVAMRERAAELAARWHRSGYDLDLGIGVAKGFATIGAIGFEGRWDYGAIGTVTNLAARLCSEAKPGQILISPRLLPELEQILEVEEVGLLAVKGLARPVRALNIVRLRNPA